MDLALLEKIKKLTISALLADDLLMGVLVLKGGNALGIAYDITSRGSLDIDFSMEKDFSPEEKHRIKRQLDHLLNQEFNREGFQVFDVDFADRPEKIDDRVKDFWGGYRIEFKVVPFSVYQANKDNLHSLRNLAIELTAEHKRTYTVDISRYEYIGKIQRKDIDGTVVSVYSPEMLALEKLRAICQQDPDYKEIIFSMRRTPRPRDFYDIYNLSETFHIDFTTGENIHLMNHIFEAKKVPVNFICRIPDLYEYHFNGWESVLQTLDQREDPEDFRYYFDYVVKQFAFVC